MIRSGWFVGPPLPVTSRLFRIDLLFVAPALGWRHFQNPRKPDDAASTIHHVVGATRLPARRS
jgi:hypothetical protein